MSLRSWKATSSSGNKDRNSKPKNPKEIAERWERSRLYLVTDNMQKMDFYCCVLFLFVYFVLTIYALGSVLLHVLLSLSNIGNYNIPWPTEKIAAQNSRTSPSASIAPKLISPHSHLAKAAKKLTRKKHMVLNMSKDFGHNKVIVFFIYLHL